MNERLVERDRSVGYARCESSRIHQLERMYASPSFTKQKVFVTGKQSAAKSRAAITECGVALGIREQCLTIEEKARITVRFDPSPVRACRHCLQRLGKPDPYERFQQQSDRKNAFTSVRKLSEDGFRLF